MKIKQTIEQIQKVFIDNIEYNDMTWHDSKEDTIRYLTEDCNMTRVEAVSILDIAISKLWSPYGQRTKNRGIK
jgi:hypothetical protein